MKKRLKKAQLSRQKKIQLNQQKKKEQFKYDMMSKAELIRHCMAYAAALHELAKVMTVKDSGE